MDITWATLIGLLFTAGIFLLAFQAFLLRGVNAMLDAKTEPLKENQARMEKRMDNLETEVKGISAKLDKLLSK